MKILKDGRPQKGWATEVICSGNGNGGGGCGALILVEQGDVYLTHQSHCGETDTFHTFRCASCGVETDLGGHVRLPQFSKFPERTEWLRINHQPQE